MGHTQGHGTVLRAAAAGIARLRLAVPWLGAGGSLAQAGAVRVGL